MDELDRSLVGLLRKDARASVADLATALHVSRGTVTNRMARLERDAVILGYTAIVADDAAPIRAWTSIRVEGNATNSVLAALLREPGVTAVYDTNGKWDLLAQLETKSTAELSELLNRIRQLPSITDSETSIHLATLG
jgi:DNA-binding Lrp family transcriptional regulator